MNTLDKNQRYLIHGFHYEISRNGELWNTNTGRLIRPGSDGRYLLRKQKRMYRFTLGRLLYAVEHEVSPDSIKGIVIMTEDSKPVLMTRGDYWHNHNTSYSSSQRDLVQRYREAVRIAEVMIDFYEKSDMEEMTSAFTTYESKIKGYMYSGGFTNSQDVVPAGMYRNKQYIEKDVDMQDVDIAVRDILYDPQTSGGLLVSVKAEYAEELVKDMKLNGSIEAKIIGYVKSKDEKYITVR